MRAHESNLLLLLGLLAAIGSPVAAFAVTDDGDHAEEIETDDLPPWAELDAGGEAPPQAHVQMLRDYGSDIPDPEDVMAGRRPRPTAGDRVDPVPAEPPARVEFEDFRSELSPHGRWVDTPEYGTVFVPYRQTQVTGWRPYLYGQWAWTAYGWTWVSDEPFGWATYHYGRWAHRPALGWVWVPGYTWGPAWVAWRYGEGAIGWAPLYPGYVTWTTSYPYHTDHWIFVGPSFFYGHPIHRHWYRDRSAHWYGRSHWSRNWRGSRGHVYVGPTRRHVERSIHGRVLESRVIAVGRSRRGETFTGRGAGSAGEVRVYRPTNRGAVRSRAVDAGRRQSPRHDPRVTPAQRVEPRPGAGNRPAPAQRADPRSAAGNRLAPAQRAEPRSGAGNRPAPAQKADPRSGGGNRLAPSPAQRMQAPSRQAAPPAAAQPRPAPAAPERKSAPSAAPAPRPNLRPSGGPAGGLRPAPSMPSPKSASRQERRSSTSSPSRSPSAPKLGIGRSSGAARSSPASVSRPAAPRPVESSRGGGRSQR